MDIEKNLVQVCELMLNNPVKIVAIVGDCSYTLENCNIIGNVIESIFFSNLSKNITIQQGPKQNSPDIFVNYSNDKIRQEIEIKTFLKNPAFDIGNFQSFIDALSQPDGVRRKLFNTKFIIFEYTMNVDGSFTITHFWMKHVWNIVGQTKKYPLAIQNKRNTWYNIRPCPKNQWDDSCKSPHEFIQNIQECILQCPNNIEDRQQKIEKILENFQSCIRENLM